MNAETKIAMQLASSEILGIMHKYRANWAEAESIALTVVGMVYGLMLMKIPEEGRAEIRQIVVEMFNEALATAEATLERQQNNNSYEKKN